MGNYRKEKVYRPFPPIDFSYRPKPIDGVAQIAIAQKQQLQLDLKGNYRRI
jgi:hypothetical protein